MRHQTLDKLLSPQDDRSKCIVQKFGGTSIGKFPLNIVQNVIKPRVAHDRVIVVCSARSSSTKGEGTTNRLIRAYRSSLVPQSNYFRVLIQRVRAEHVQIAQAYIRSPTIVCRLIQDIHDECIHVLSLLEAVRLAGHATTETLNMVVSTGEVLAGQFLCAMLRDHGVSSEFINLARELDVSESQAINQQFYDQAAISLSNIITKSSATVPVVTSYFGTIHGGLLQKIGRGYTDVCASLLAIGLQARELQVWKEVDGIYTADPRKIPTAKVLKTITPEEASELSFHGSEVIQSIAMAQAMQARIPVRIRNIMNPCGSGTFVLPESLFKEPGRENTLDTTMRNASEAAMLLKLRSTSTPAALTSKHDITVLNVTSTERSMRHSFFARLFAILDSWRLSIDLICTSEVQVSMALHSELPFVTGESEPDSDSVNSDLQGAIAEMQRYGSVNVIENLAIVSLVGKNMKHSSGTAGKMFSTLGDNDINIEMIAQGASEISISCVIGESEVDRAMSLLHAKIFADHDVFQDT